MTIKASWSAGDVLTAADLTDTLAAKAAYPTGGTNGQALVKSGTTTAWGSTSKVVQIVTGVYATQTSINSATWVDSGLTATITPTSASNNVLVFVIHAGCGKSAASTGLGSRLLRAGSTIATFGTNDALTGSTDGNWIGAIALNLLDSPASVAATVYKTQINNSQAVGSARICDGSAVSSIVLMEVTP
jgi:hypothetical protein